VSAGQLTVSVDGAQVLTTPVTLPAHTLLGFTGGDGGITDRHAVSNVAITTLGSGTTATAPGAPTAVTATAGNAAATVRWSAPASDGGSPITGYTVTANPGGKTATVTGTPPATTTTVSGLTNSRAYTFAVSATNAVGAGPASAASAPVTPTAVTPTFPPDLSVADTVLNKPAAGTTGQASFTVTLSAPAIAPVTVSYKTGDGTAKAGTDYIALPASTLTFAPGQISKTVPVTVNGTGVHANGSTDLHLLLSGANGAATADGDGKARLVNTLGPLSIYVGNTVVTQSGTQPTKASFPLTLSAPTAAGESVTVVVSTADGSASSAGGDYTALAATTVTFGPGTSKATVDVPVAAAPGPKANKTFTLNLATASPDTVIGRNKATATIVNTG
jgi:hypothetical protein